ncbi:histone deacetylase family protein [Qingshengfaniella alkalisoli]|uniref:Histone deacetylase family protein n=1 Tax=Qingshengfaniella alkalisoli TaxID=2599296 RepID=A0A5B8IWK8_9RHOB|nr:histone deacetylase family protein [Qingshengfaniella alkalisoli]QDY70034.1 histone deacetylase family protein [Qingshengfaniella alkalisoli]
MTTALYSHPDCLTHETPSGHPEQVARLQVVLDRLEGPPFDRLTRLEAPVAAEDALLRCHLQSYLDLISASIPASGSMALDGDTHVSAGSLAAARRAAGACVAAVDLVLRDGADNAFAAVRPPGHHAERETAMGFCLFGSLAIAAKHALDHHGLDRVAIVDFDVHHGNGTQDLLWEDDRILFVSMHQSPLYPGTGTRDETGAYGQIINLPMAPGTAGDGFMAVFEDYVAPAVDAFEPEFLLVSAGFDAHRADPLAQMDLETDDFVQITERLCDLADAHCGGRLVSTLEGGYDLDALADSVAAHVAVLIARGEATKQGQGQ